MCGNHGSICRRRVCRSEAALSDVASFDEVLSAAQTGAPWAFQVLYESLAPRVAGYLRARGAVHVEDLTSEVFLGVFTGLAKFRGDEAKLRSWVFTIAHHRLVDARRQESRRPSLCEYDPEADGRRTLSGEEEAFAALGTDRVRQLLATLAPDQRDVLLLRIVGDLSLEQVAQVVGKRVGAVKALQHRGLAALRRQLDREGVSL
jgi:RNA polymerase sigma factor (sigma-70 family)